MAASRHGVPFRHCREQRSRARGGANLLFRTGLLLPSGSHKPGNSHCGEEKNGGRHHRSVLPEIPACSKPPYSGGCRRRVALTMKVGQFQEDIAPWGRMAHVQPGLLNIKMGL